jgi:cytoskeleton protein RodZ
MPAPPPPAMPPSNKPGSFGERLRRERELRGVKLEEIAESTKIGKRNLLALEEEHFDRLPGGIFNKGFVRAYAKYLGLDEEQAVNDFMAASASYDQPDAVPPLAGLVRPAVMPSEATLRRKERVWIIAALLALAIAGILYLKFRGSATPGVAAPVRSAARPASATGQPAAHGAATEPASPMTASNAAGTPQSSPVSSGSPPSSAASAGAPSGRSDASAAPVAASIPTSQASAAPSSASSGSATAGISLVIHAVKQSWISVTADGQPVLDATLAPGEARLARADQQLVLKTGNAAGIEVSFNGKWLPALGGENQVKTLIFTPQGLQR